MFYQFMLQKILTAAFNGITIVDYSQRQYDNILWQSSIVVFVIATQSKSNKNNNAFGPLMLFCFVMICVNGAFSCLCIASPKAVSLVIKTYFTKNTDFCSKLIHKKILIVITNGLQLTDNFITINSILKVCVYYFDDLWKISWQW